MGNHKIIDLYSLSTSFPFLIFLNPAKTGVHTGACWVSAPKGGIDGRHDDDADDDEHHSLMDT